jgi:methylated-DNA-[protein]-cysteine S-methyltransferase
MKRFNCWCYINSEIGFLNLISNENELISISFSDEAGVNSEFQPQILTQAKIQLNEYFQGTRKEFQLKINPEGSKFQIEIWKLVSQVGYGKTASYLDIAQQAGSAAKTRAVGMANSKNPLPIIIPCHRIIGKKGDLTGYAGEFIVKHTFFNMN